MRSNLNAHACVPIGAKHRSQQLVTRLHLAFDKPIAAKHCAVAYRCALDRLREQEVWLAGLGQHGRCLRRGDAGFIRQRQCERLRHARCQQSDGLASPRMPHTTRASQIHPTNSPAFETASELVLSCPSTPKMHSLAGILVCLGSVFSGAAWTVVSGMLLQMGEEPLDSLSVLFCSSPTCIATTCAAVSLHRLLGLAALSCTPSHCEVLLNPGH